MLHNLLHTFASRYSDHQGYWLFGQLPADLDSWSVDLQANLVEGDAPVEVARRLAIRRFNEQMGKARLDMAVVREAELSWTRHEPASGWQGNYQARGHRVELRARVVTDKGRTFEKRHSFFVAVHDPGRESRRSPPNWGP